MQFDIIICTYNRPQLVRKLVNLISCSVLSPQTIIIIDSSEKPENYRVKGISITCISTRHKNQPYQRYLGYLASRSEILIYLDDDMEILDKVAFEKVIDEFKNSKIAGLALNFKNENKFLKQDLPKSFTRSKKNLFYSLIRKISANPDLENGQYWWCGVKGKQPDEGGATEWFSGGAFAAKKRFLYKNFNYSLFSIYEAGLGKGEDGILAYTLSKQGNISFLPQNLFYHNDPGCSVYSQNLHKFAIRVSYSRYYLSLEYGRLNNHNIMAGFFIYNWYMAFRVVGLATNYIFAPSKERFSLITGYLKGWFYSFTKHYKPLNAYKYWENEANGEINASSKY